MPPSIGKPGGGGGGTGGGTSWPYIPMLINSTIKSVKVFFFFILIDS